MGVFGQSVASAGDVNGDGYSDLVVGAYRVGNATGRAHVYLGSATGLPSSPSLSLSGPDGTDGFFGMSVASAGDVNGDGYGDLVVGAFGANSNTGRVHVYLGSAMGLPTSPNLSLSGPDGTGGEFGYSVANAGDVNGDGFADLVVGPYGVGSRTGRVHIYLGSVLGLPASPSVSLTNPDGADGFFGKSVASAGDVNGDGYADLVVGANRLSNGTGRAHFYLGSATGLPTSPSVSLTDPDGMGSFGGSVASAGDINGDGYADLVVGAHDASSGTGLAHVYLGSATGLPTSPSRSLSGPDGTGGGFGYSVANVGMRIDNCGHTRSSRQS